MNENTEENVQSRKRKVKDKILRNKNFLSKSRKKINKLKDVIKGKRRRKIGTMEIQEQGFLGENHQEYNILQSIKVG